MSKVLTWNSDEKVTPRNSWARLYFDPGRSRLMLSDGFLDFSELRDRAHAKVWCDVNGVEFFDHRPELLPPQVRDRLRQARAVGVAELRELKPKWRLVPFVGAKLFTPQIAHIPSWRDARAARRAPCDYPAPRFWNRTHHHVFSCQCYECCHSA